MFTDFSKIFSNMILSMVFMVELCNLCFRVKVKFFYTLYNRTYKMNFKNVLGCGLFYYTLTYTCKKIKWNKICFNSCRLNHPTLLSFVDGIVLEMIYNPLHSMTYFIHTFPEVYYYRLKNNKKLFRTVNLLEEYPTQLYYESFTIN